MEERGPCFHPNIKYSVNFCDSRMLRRFGPAGGTLALACLSYTYASFQDGDASLKPRPLIFSHLMSGVPGRSRASPTLLATSPSAGNPSTVEDTAETITNWSGTHSVTLQKVHAPENRVELEDLVKNTSGPIRPMGSALSPNGLSFAPPGTSCVSLSLMDKVLEVDAEKKTVRVEAGCRVEQVIEVSTKNARAAPKPKNSPLTHLTPCQALRPHGLTLSNLASIAAQQVGGFVNAGAHGTGALIPPVDDFVLSMTIITPAFGAVTVSRGDAGLNKMVFDMCRVGLGAFGVAAEYTLCCVPAHDLVETTTVLTRAEAVESLPELLRKHRHMRYMWIPYEDAVVVVTNDPVVGEDFEAKNTPQDTLKPLKDLLLAKKPSLDASLVDSMGMGELRDALLDIDPLSTPWIRKVNAAEHKFWKLAQGTRCLPSDKLLQFDCGGQQWVQEVCFPTGSLASPNKNDLSFMLKLLSSLESKGLPAPSPIEQR